ncbi:plasmid replication protein, CyRepA1 family [Methylobacterium nigriterrae]|uniref:plasmid replication protein, CyRepA1 family n=1 Tax=Methylobacterium nigriterrae TaxID=3127512 RepID=UPI003013CC35
MTAETRTPARKRPYRKRRVRKTPKRFGICLDSLHQIRLEDGFELVIIDESEQVFGHLFSDTITSRGHQDRLYKILREVVRGAKHVVALDADLGYLTHNTLARMVSRPGADGAWQRDKPIRLWINETPSADRRTIELYENKNHLISDLLQAVADGKRCFVTANSKKLIVKLAAILRNRFGATKRLITVTADTGSRAEVQDFVANAAARAALYDVILCSPSLGTGVDITFPDNAKLVDAVFGFCEPGINTHLDFDQQLARVRHPGAAKVWITPRRFTFETHVDVVRHDILRAGLYKDMLDGFDDDGKPRFIEDDPLIEMAVLLKSAERASKNNLRGNYVRYKQARGCTIIHVGKNLDRSVDGHAALKRGADLAGEELVAEIVGASVLARPELEQVQKSLEAGGVVSEATRWSYERTRLELFYRAVASPDLVRLDRGGRFRREVRLFEEVTRLPPEAVPANPLEPLHKDLSFIGDARQDLAPVLVRLFRLTPLWREHRHDPLPFGVLETRPGRLVPQPDAIRLVSDGRVAGMFDAEAVFDTRDLEALARFMTDNKGPLESLLGCEVRSDILRKPAQQLGQVLGLLGLGHTRVGTQKVSGRKIRRYRLDAAALSAMEEIVARRERKKGWASLADRYGPQMDPSDNDDWSGIEAEIERAAEFVRGTTGDITGRGKE